ncbi:MAG: hypothetical protein QG574_4471 [Cyanobacteriota bacterium erpe_2018_sw_21hr_WHONDRS-SW48-000092_B_bin.40]|jgi:hypothetical protein|nr:hypothetical protein [Cyanobacteriota bacterium erpe_2018_sw_21hr_WHONDRS-SW48-000092_B_bin.40]
MVTACRLWPLIQSGAELGSWVRNGKTGGIEANLTSLIIGNNEAIAAVESAHVRQAERRW